MQRIPSPTGATVSYDQYGSGPLLILVSGNFSALLTEPIEVGP
jgi:hypothetical protein